jgi:hypothetical protein
LWAFSCVFFVSGTHITGFYPSEIKGYPPSEDRLNSGTFETLPQKHAKWRKFKTLWYI